MASDNVDKMYCICLKHKENFDIHNRSHGTVNVNVATKKIPKAYLYVSVVKMMLRVTIYEVANGSWEAENTKYQPILYDEGRSARVQKSLLP